MTERPPLSQIQRRTAYGLAGLATVLTAFASFGVATEDVGDVAAVVPWLALMACVIYLVSLAISVGVARFAISRDPLRLGTILTGPFLLLAAVFTLFEALI